LFSIVSAILFHSTLGDQNQFIHLLKNVAIAGGFLTLAAHGPGSISIDALWGKSARTRHATA
jgi:putative oxidoreductase